MTVAEAKKLCQTGSDNEIRAAYNKEKASIRYTTSIRRICDVCRVTDKLYSEMRKRGIRP